MLTILVYRKKKKHLRYCKSTSIAFKKINQNPKGILVQKYGKELVLYFILRRVYSGAFDVHLMHGYKTYFKLHLVIFRGFWKPFTMQFSDMHLKLFPRKALSKITNYQKIKIIETQTFSPVEFLPATHSAKPWTLKSKSILEISGTLLFWIFFLPTDLFHS